MQRYDHDDAIWMGNHEDGLYCWVWHAGRDGWAYRLEVDCSTGSFVQGLEPVAGFGASIDALQAARDRALEWIIQNAVELEEPVPTAEWLLAEHHGELKTIDPAVWPTSAWCCERAKQRTCVCVLSTCCPGHGIRHTGTHD